MLDARETPIQWTDSRRDLHRLLCDVHPTIGALYRFAVDIGAEPPRLGEARTREAMMGHCMREMMNNLPEALNDVAELPLRGQNSASATNRLVKAYEAADIRVESETVTQRGALVTVPGDLVDAVRGFVADQGVGARRRRLRDAASVLGRLDENDPALQPWSAARDFFMSLTHLDSGPASSAKANEPKSTDTEICRHMEVVEASLAVRLGDFFDNLHSIEDLAEEANRRVGGQEQ
jgi:hypothetical protein